MDRNETNSIIYIFTLEANRIFGKTIIWSCIKQDLTIKIFDELPETGSFVITDLIWSDAQGKYFIGTGIITVQTKLGFIISQYGRGELYNKHRDKYISFDAGSILHEYGHYLGYWRHNDRPYSIMNDYRLCIDEVARCTL